MFVANIIMTLYIIKYILRACRIVGNQYLVTTKRIHLVTDSGMFPNEHLVFEDSEVFKI